MEKFEHNGVKFTMFETDGIKFLCTGNPTGKLKFDFASEICDYCTVVGATSVVSGKGDIDELYNAWLKRTEFERNVLGIQF